jgi:hypothetical protein
VLLLTAACAQHAGQQATKGATEAVEKDIEENRPAEEVSKHAVEGAVTALSDPHEVERLKAVVSQLAHEAVIKALDAAIQGGTVQEGSAIETLAAQAAAGARTQLVEGLARDLDPPHGRLAASLSALAHRTSQSAVEGARAGLHPWPLVIAFAFGAACALLVTALVGWLRGRRRRPPVEPAPLARATPAPARG